MDGTIIFASHYQQKNNPPITNVMTKIIFGLAVAIAAVSVSAFTTINDVYEGETVGKVNTDQWTIVIDEDQGITWDCYAEGTACKGTLKAGATPDGQGYFSDSEVNQTLENKHFEVIPDLTEQLKK